MKSSVVSYSFRLLPGQDLRAELFRYAKENQLKAATVISAVGSLSEAYLRLADQRQATRFQGPYEIVSLTGTLGGDTLHMHLAISDGFGVTVGGHLQSGCIVHTTCELVLIESVDLVYRREPDTKTGYNELVISSR